MANLARAAREQHPGAVVRLRTPNSIHIETAPGQIVAYINGLNDYHLPDETEIDTTWVNESVDGFQWGMSLAEYHARARTTFNAGDLVRFTHPVSGHWVVYDPQSINWVDSTGSRSQIAIKQAVSATPGTGPDDDLLTWSGAYGSGRHSSYRCTPQRLEKLITIDTAADLPAPPGYMVAPIWFEAEFILKHSVGLDLYLDGALWAKQNNVRVKTAGRIEFRNANGETLFHMVEPFARDADGNFSGGEYEVRNQSGTYFVTVRVPQAWLATAAYPVAVDPSTSIEADTSFADVYGAASSFSTARATSSGFSNTDCRVGMNNPGNYWVYRSFLRFDTYTALLGVDAVTQVNMKLTCITDSSGTDFDVQIVKQDWGVNDPIDDAERETVYDGCLAGTADDSIWRNTSGMSTNTPYTSGNLSTSWVSTTNSTFYSLRSSRDYDNIAPTGAEAIFLATPTHATASYRPTLVIIYTDTRQRGAPSSDSSAGGWTASSGSDLYAMIDEESASDTDYIQSAQNPQNDVCVIALSSLSDPADHTNHIVYYRYRKDSNGQSIDVIVRLKQGVTTIASNTLYAIGTGWVNGYFVLSEAEAASITNYADLRIEFEADAP